LNINDARTEPYIGYFEFHEHINITIKIMSASLFHTLDYLNNSSDDRELGNLIRNADQSWNSPPIWSIKNTFSEKEVYGFASELGLISSFSALDDFIESVEGEISRWNSKLAEEKQLIPSNDYETTDEKIITLFNKYSWSILSIQDYLPLIKYFRLSRNCYVHRRGKASSALCEYSISQELKDSVDKYMKNGVIKNLPVFEKNEKIIFDPKTIFFCSYMFKKITDFVNLNLLGFLGQEGVVNMAANHAFFKDKAIKTSAYRSPEAVLNSIIFTRYRVKLEDDQEVIKIAKKLRIWKNIRSEFESNYDI
jgi:hypothetical protein